MKQREENKRRSTRQSRSFPKNRRHKRQKSTKVKDKLEFHSSNPLYLYLISLMCLRVWRRYCENLAESTERAVSMTTSKGQEPVAEQQNTLENALNSSTAPIVRPISQEEGRPMHKNSYIVMPNYILDNA